MGKKSCGWEWVIRGVVALVMAMMLLRPGIVPRAQAQNSGGALSTTTVQGTVYRADGTPASGTLLVSWPAFTTAQNQAVAAGSLSASIGADGVVSVHLTPNAGAVPAGSYYTVSYHLSDGTVSREYWVVPASGTSALAAVRATVEPATVAVQPSVTPAYVQGTVASMASNYLPLSGGTLSGAVTGPSLAAKQLGGLLYADQWETTPTSNDGISMTLAQCASLPNACQVVAPAQYTQLEAEPWGGPFGYAYGDNQGPAYGQRPGAILDLRWGPPIWIYQPGTTTQGNRFSSGAMFVPRIVSVPQGIGSHPGAGLMVDTGFFAGSRNFSGGLGDQVGFSGLAAYTTQNTPASMNNISSVLNENSVGDAIGLSVRVTSRGGIDGGDNEGVETQDMLYEAADVFQGRINSITPQTATAYPNPCTGPCTVFNTTQTQGAKGIAGSELQLIDVSKGDSSGYLSLISGATITATGADWDTQYGDTTFRATIPATITEPQSDGSTNQFPMTNVTLSYALATGTPVVGPACLFDTNSGVLYECNQITAVNTAAQTVTFAIIEHAYHAGSLLAQGGMTGMGFAPSADCVGPGNMHGMGGAVANTICSVWPIEYNAAGNVVTLMSGGRVGFSTSSFYQMGSGGVVTATLSGGAVTSCTASGGSGYGGGTDASGFLTEPPLLTYTVTGAGATAPVVAIQGQSGGALQGCTVVSPGANIATLAVTVNPNNGYTVYPMTRTINTWNPQTGMIDGSSMATDALMPSASSFGVGDTVQQPHYYAASYTAMNAQIFSWQRGAAMAGYSTMFGGAFQTNDYAETLSNLNSPTLYYSFPGGSTPWVTGAGTMGTPYGISLSGPYRNGLWMQLPPYGGNGGTVTGALAVSCRPYCSAWAQRYSVLDVQNGLNNNMGEDVLGFSPATQTWTWTAGSTSQGGWNPYCSVTLAGTVAGGFSISCNGKASSFDTAGNLIVAGAVKTRGALSGATINGEVTVDGATYATLNAAWTAAVNLASTTGQNQTVRLGPGTYPVTATLNEPANGTCVSLLGSAGTTVNADSTEVTTTLTVPNALDADLIYLSNAAQAQGCAFKDLNVLAQSHATHGFELQWFRGLLIDNVTVNDTTAEGILLGEENTASAHQSNFLMRNVTVSYSSAAFTPANRPAYGVHLEKTAMDSELESITVRNALTASLYNEGTGNTGYAIHGFGYPYTCATAPCVNNAASGTAANASYATSYVIYDTGGSGNVWTDTYADSPAVAGFYIGANGTAIHGGHIQWPDLTSFPAANLAYVASTVTNNLLIADVDCLGMNAGVNWIAYAGSSGNPPSYASVHHLTGCGNYYQALEPAQVSGFSSGGANINDPSGAVPRVWSTPIAAAANYPAYSVQMYTGYQGDVFQAHFSGVTPFFNITAQGTIRSNGGLALSTIINTASALTLTTANRTVIARAAGGAQTITLPSCYTALADRSSPTGLELTIIKSDSSANAVTLQTVSSQNINYSGVSAQTLAIATAGKRTLVCGPDYNWYAF